MPRIVIPMFVLAVKLQMEILERNFEQERRTLRQRVSELERKLEQVTQEVAVAESTLAVRNSELDTLQTNLRELEELREMKEVMFLYWLRCLTFFFYN